MNIKQMVDYYNWATQHGLKEAGLEYWFIRRNDGIFSLYFKGERITKIYEYNTIQIITNIAKGYLREHYADDKDAKRFLKYIDDVIK